MNSDYTPTIESLLDQHALHLTGQPELIKRCLEFMDDNYIWKPLETIKQSYDDTCELVSEDYGLYKNEVIDIPQTFRLQELSAATIQVNPGTLYTVHLDNNFTVTAHVRSNNGSFDKVIYQKIDFNPKRLTHSIKALCRAIDQSKAFFVCAKCHQLIDANFQSGTTPSTCAYNACGSMVKQPFDTSEIDRVSIFFNSNIRIDKLDTEVLISIGEITWPHPHFASFIWSPKVHLPLNTTPKEARAAAQKIQEGHVFYRTCKHCNTPMNVGHMYDHETCYNCAMHVYGVIY